MICVSIAVTAGCSASVGFSRSVLPSPNEARKGPEDSSTRSRAAEISICLVIEAPLLSILGLGCWGTPAKASYDDRERRYSGMAKHAGAEDAYQSRSVAAVHVNDQETLTTTLGRLKEFLSS